MAVNNDREVELMLDELFHVVSDAKSFPISPGKCLVDRNEALDLIDMIRTSLPREIEEARRLVAGKKSYISNAKQEAELLKKSAEERSRQLIDNQEILIKAHAESRDLIAEAENKSREMKQQATMFVGDTLKTSEDALSEALAVIVKTREMYVSALRNLSPPEIAE